MTEGLITCPSCGHEFELTDAITGKIREHLREELLQDVNRREAKLREQSQALKEESEAINKTRESLEEEIENRLKLRLKEAEIKATKTLEGKYADQLKELKGIVEERESEVKEFRKQELELRKRQRELEAAQEESDLKIARTLDEERAKIRQEASNKAAEDHRLKDLEKDRLIEGLKSSLEDMKRKAEQGSVESQGEVLEQDFEAQLKGFFRQDDIQPVPKGIRGADLIQKVRTPLGAECGVLLWETKNTKAWSGQWVSKLKDDMIEVRASIAILVSVVLPEGIGRFGQVDGIWVSDPLSAIPLAAALREGLVAISRERTAAEGKNEKMEEMYRYLAGTEFKQKIESIVHAFVGLQEQVNKERRAMEKQWKQREKQIERVIKNTVGLYGDMQGIIGGQIPTIPALELDGVDRKSLPYDPDSDSSGEDDEEEDNGG